MFKSKYRFESEVHLGLLIIVFLLLFVSFISNYVLYRSKTNLRDQTIARLQVAAVAVTRGVTQSFPVELTDQTRQEYQTKYGLSGLQVISSRPPDETMESRRQWFAQIIHQLPPAQLPSLVNELLGADFRRLTRGKASEYFYVSPLSNGAGGNLLILSTNVPELAYLEDASRTVVWTEAGALAFVGILYLVLSRFIFKPFRGIRRQAALAGRPVSSQTDDADLVVEEYRQVIAELRGKEAELVRLNAAIQSRAESLEQFNQYLLSSIESGIITLDNEGRVKTVNDSAAKMLGVSTESCSGEPFKKLFGEIREIPVLLTQALKSGKAGPYKEIRHNDGLKVRTLGVAISFIRDQQQLPVGLSILLNDLSELTELRSQLEKKNQLAALGEMSGGLAHQLRNSMGAINGYAALAKRRIEKMEAAPAGEAVDQLLGESKEAEELIAKFLNFAKPFDYSPRPTSITNLVREVVVSFRSRDDLKPISFRFDGDADATVSADPLLLKQALTNLVENAALAYEGTPGSVVVSVRGGQNGIELRVSDSACGIPADRIDKIFTPFYSSRPSGTGLGLPLAARIVDLHGGKVTVNSVVGKGSTFLVELPAALDPRPALS